MGTEGGGQRRKIQRSRMRELWRGKRERRRIAEEEEGKGRLKI